MRHTPLDELGEVAGVYPELKRTPPMSRDERLTRWAALLDRLSRRRLATLRGTEYHVGPLLDAMRSDGSAISVAFGDPLFRAEGLKGDTYGDAKRFFELTDWQLHDILCHCHFGSDVSAATSASRVRAAIGGTPGLVDRFRRVFGG
jgi:hypothetical protein